VEELDALKQLPFVLDRTDLSKWLGPKHEGKVRDSYVTNGTRFIVATDRISVFDFNVGHVPFKGQVLTQMAQFWFENTKDIISNHILSIPDPNVTVSKQCRALPVEMVVRGYITGVTTTAMWYQYSRGVRTFCGHELPDGLKKNQRLPTPLITPSTKETRKGVHDRSVSAEALIKEVSLDADLYQKIETAALALFQRGTEISARAGYILVDTKYEFGLDEDDNLVLIDEIHTPDSSRFWAADTYEERLSDGQDMDYYDKEHVRLWLAARGLDKFGQEAERSNIPNTLFAETSLRFVKVYEEITGRKFEYAIGDPSARIEQSLHQYLEQQR
jgi:phosphoribosylaminoimidazole-succinocarboxamide synthase